MNRTARDNTGGRPAPVQRIELNEDKLHTRFILAVVLLAVGAGAILFALIQLLTPESGWREVEVSRGGYSVAGEFVLWYELGAGGESVTAENKRLSLAYTQAAAEAYQIFNAHERYEGVGNLASVSDRPNETVTVDAALYRALSQLAEAGRREIFLAPVYEMYYSLFHCQDVSETIHYDPFRNEELAAWCRQAAAFAADPAAVRLELPGEGQVRLCVSEEYLSFLREYGVTDILDLFWMRNAFVADFLAERLTAEGFTHGCLSSADGFVRALDGRGTAFALTLFHRGEDDTVYPAAEMEYRGPMSLVSLYSYPVGEGQAAWYYAMPDGTVRHPFVDIADGLCRTALPELTGYAREEGCAAVLLRLLPVFIGERADADALAALPEAGIETVRCEDGAVLYTQADAVFTALYAGESVTFRAERVS